MRTHARVSIFVHKRMFCSGTFPPALPSFLTARCSCGIISLRRPGRADALKHSLSIFSYLKGFYFIFTSRDGLARHRLLITSFSLRRVTSWRCRSSRRVSWSPPLRGVTPRGPRPPPRSPRCLRACEAGLRCGSGSPSFMFLHPTFGSLSFLDLRINVLHKNGDKGDPKLF